MIEHPMTAEQLADALHPLTLANAEIGRLYSQWEHVSNGIRAPIDALGPNGIVDPPLLARAKQWIRTVDALADTWREDVRLEIMRRWARGSGLPTTWRDG